MDLIEKQNNKVDKAIIPALRFPDFVNDGEWKKDTFENTFLFLPNNTLSRAELNYENGSTKNVHYGDVLIRFGDCLDVQTNVLPFISDEAIADRLQSSRLQDGDVIIADTAEDETVGKCTEIFNVSDENVVSGLHTIPIRPKIQFAIPYLGFYFNSDSYRKQLLPLMQGVKVMSISKAAIGKTIVAYPSILTEQCKIGSCLSSMDAYISATKEKLELLKAYKKGLMQKLFPAKGKKLPELRFKEFEKDGEWEEVPFGSIITECKDVSKVENEDVLLSSAIEGVFLNSEIFTHQRGSSNIGYRKLRKNMLILSAQNLHLGNANVNLRFEHGLISPAYKIYEINNCFPEFLYHWIKKDSTKEFFFDATIEGASVCRRNVMWNKLYEQQISNPSFLEQRKIASCLSAMDEAINAYTEKVGLLGQFKKGLMQQMFVN